jgi:hexosaminidase
VRGAAWRLAPVAFVVVWAGTAPLTAQSPATQAAAGSTPSPEVAVRYPIIPWPRHLEPGEGRYAVDERSRITLSHPDDAALVRMGDRLAGWIENAIGVAVPVLGEPLAEPEPLAIALLLEPQATEPGESEAYTLDITPSGVALRATTHAGLRHGLQTLRQLLPTAAETSAARRPRFRAELPAVHIDDAPRFAYRGLHLDVARHFFPVAFIKRYLDLMALYKLNRFHWHLTDDQGWRIEIERYPRLTGVGAFRSETLVGHAGDVPVRYDGRRYGGFYTQAEVREVVRYAAGLGITIVPEIEMPGHALAALAAYPELACTEGPFEVATGPGIFEDIYCPSEETFAFLEGVLTEVMALFPGEFIHIGGDEAPTTRWRESALAQEVMRREGLADERALQSWFIGRIERFLNAHGRRMIGWDEIAEGALGRTSAVMYWRDWLPEVPEDVAGRGHDLVMTPNSRLYLDHYQGDGQVEPLAIGGLATLDEVYAYEPVPDGFTAEQARHVLGAQGNVWTEYMKTPAKVEYMAFPRALALAEVVWSPAHARDLEAFRRRLGANLKRLDALDVNYRTPPREQSLGTPPRHEVPDTSAPNPPSETTPFTFTFTAAGDYGFDDAAAATLELIRPAGADFHLALGDLSYSPTRLETDWRDFVTARVGEGSDDTYRSGEGTVFAIFGSAGQVLYELDERDPEAGYFAAWMGANHAPRRGLLSLTVSPSAIVGAFQGSTETSDFADRFVIGGGE